uniref:Putative toutatis n=1 Tax=Corethrella appendiculata TaxID=1370023 RepID=W4VRC8_9DIPT
MDKDGDKKGNDKKGSSSSGLSGNAAADQAALLDAASLFAYWGRDPTAMAAAAASNPLFGSHFGAAGGLGLLPNAGGGSSNTNDRFSGLPQHNTMAVAASQAASLAGLHSASWWSMAQLAAQDYFARLQASGMSQLPFPHPDLAGAFQGLPGLGALGAQATGSGGSSSSSNSKNNLSNKSKKRERSSNSGSSTSSHQSNPGGSSSGNNNHSSLSYKNSASPSSLSTSQANAAAAYKQSLYSSANLHKELLAITAAAAASNNSNNSSSMKKSSNSSSSHHHSGSGGSSSQRLSSSGSHSLNSSSSSSKSQQISSPSITISATNQSGSGNYQNSSSSRSKDSNSNKTSADLSISASMNALNSLTQFGNLDLSQQNVTATMNALAASSAKAKDYMSSGILNDPSSLLGVRLPPDTEIIKYTSSIVGPKVPGTTNRGRKKTISLDPNPFFAQMHGLSAAKRARLEGEYSSSIPNAAHQNDRIEVIKLPPTITSNGVYNIGKNSGKESSDQASDWNAGGLNLSVKSSTTSSSGATASVGGSTTPINLTDGGNSDVDAPLNLSLKSDTKGSSSSVGGNSSNSLQSLSSITAALGNNSSTNSDQRSKHKEGRHSKNRQTHTTSTSSSSTSTTSISSNHFASLGLNSSLSELLKISNYDEYDDYPSNSSTQYKEGRPRNLGRGVSKPKKNTVASLLAQSRAVGSKPLTPQQMLSQEADLEKLRLAMIEASQSMDTSNTDTESIAESGLSESEGEDQVNIKDLRAPVDKGWRRETIIRGLTKNGQIKGDVFYYAPGSQNKLKNINQVLQHLEILKAAGLTKDNFSFSAKAIVGTFLQPAPLPYATDGEYIKMTDVEVARRLEDLKMFTRHTTLNVEQRIEIARQQQALREAKKMAKEEISKNKDKAKHAKEIERTERLEIQRRERELKNQQALEAKRKRDEELAKQKAEEAQRKQQMYLQDLNKQKELLYTVELERERRRQHTTLIKQLDNRKRYEDREKKKNQLILDKLIQREKRLAIRKRDTEILAELRKPQEDSEIPEQIELPTFPRLPGLKLTGTAFADLMMVFEFLHNFGETLGFDMESLPSLQSLHQALVCEDAVEAEEELLSVMTHLLVCAIEDPGIPNPTRHTTLLGQTLKQADITHTNVSEILRIYLHATATGETRTLTGINIEHYGRRSDPEQDQHTSAANKQFYDALQENIRWRISECLKDKPFAALNATVKSQVLAMLCNDLLLNKAVCKQIDGSLESQAQLKKERYLLDSKIRKFKLLVARKVRLEQYEKAQALALEKSMSMKLSEAAEKDSLNNTNETIAGGVTATTPVIVAENMDSTNASVPPMSTPNSDESTPTSNTPTEGLTNHKDDSNIPNSINNSTVNDKTIEESPSKTPSIAGDDKSKDLSFNDVSASEVSSAVNSTPATPLDLNSLLSKNIVNEEKNDDENSDLESEGTNVDEDEDASLNAEEAQKKLDKILETSFQNKQQLENALHQLRGKCFGQDRFWRRYWHLAKSGGVFVESMESTQSEIFKYNYVLEELHNNPTQPNFKHQIYDSIKRENVSTPLSVPNYMSVHGSFGSEKRKRGRPRLVRKDTFESQDNNSESQDNDSRTSFTNDDGKNDSQSDDNIVKSGTPVPSETSAIASTVTESIADTVDDDKQQPEQGEDITTQLPPPPPPQVVQAAPTSQQQSQQSIQTNSNSNNNNNNNNNKTAEDDLMDIEDSIPTAILVQKSNNIDETKIVEVNNQIGGINVPPQVYDSNVNNDVNMLSASNNSNSNNSDISTMLNNDLIGTGGVGVAAPTNGNCDNLNNLTTNETNFNNSNNNGNGNSGGNDNKVDDEKADSDIEMIEIKDEPIVIKDEKTEDEINEDVKMFMEKWFSIVDKEIQLQTNECDTPTMKGTNGAAIAKTVYCNITCRDPHQFQGNRWDISNNIHFFNILLEKGCDVQFNNESVLTLSGLDENEINEIINKSIKCEQIMLLQQQQQQQMQQDGTDSMDEDDKSNIEMDTKELIDTKVPLILDQQPELTVSSDVKTEENVDNSVVNPPSISSILATVDIKDIKPVVKYENKIEEVNYFTLPSYMTLTLSNLTAFVQCDTFQPLQMTAEEQRQLEEVKKNGYPKTLHRNFVPKDLRHGWWKISDIEHLNELIKSLNTRGVREKNLRQNLLQWLSESVNLTTPHHVANPRAPPPQNGYIDPEPFNAWNPTISRRIDIALLDQVEAMEDKIANASMQMKGWIPPTRDSDNESEFVTVEMIRERILGLEAAIERRYLKPPLGINTTEAQMAAIAQQEAHQNSSSSSSTSSSSSSSSSRDKNKDIDEEIVPKGLVSWRDAVQHSVTSAQLAMALYVLESCVAWDKSIMKANCQFCQSGESEDKLLLCDGCDRGYHTYCFKPRMDKIPEGDWYCYECINKATGDRKCIVCGGHKPPPFGKMVYCELCPRAYHQDCYYPPMLKIPRGKWYCTNCASKAPSKKRAPRKPKEIKSHNSSLNSSTQDDAIASVAAGTAAVSTAPLSPVHSTIEQVSALNNSKSQLQPPIITPQIETTTKIDAKIIPSSSSTSLPSTLSTNNNLSNKVQTDVEMLQQHQPLVNSDTAIIDEQMDASSIIPTQPIIQNIEESFQHIIEPVSTAETIINPTIITTPPTVPMTSSNNDEESNLVINENSFEHNTSTYNETSNDDSSLPNFNKDEEHPVKEKEKEEEKSEKVKEKKEKHKDKDRDREKDEAKELLKKEKKATKKLMKELAVCKVMLEEMEVHEDAWPFLLPVNTKQFPTYKKIIKFPMDLSTIKKRLQDLVYKSREDFKQDVLQIFDNCEVFNEDDSPVGTAGHGMRKHFEQRWAELTDKHS